ncbi:hypothetical protein LUZ60_003893 [Juncus effusus]|nr:hypothetical protein LUZ60_003893 [Juncus effusus]
MDSKPSEITSKFSEDNEAQKPPRKIGGWITFPFLSGSILGLGIALSGATSNFMVYIIQEYNVKSIDAAQISNIISGSVSLAPVLGAIVSDAFFGSYPVIAVSTGISFLSIIIFTLTAALKSLRPSPCILPSTDSCQAASLGQQTVLYLGVALLVIGTGGTRFNQGTIGADQFDRVQDQAIYFNWFFIFMYTSAIIGSTAIVYVQDSVSWVLGFGLSLASSAVSLIILLLGAKYYRRVQAQGSPFTSLARVVVATARKWKVRMKSQEGLSYYYANDDEVTTPSQSLRLFNRAALILDGDTNTAGALTKPWKLCTIQQVEDFKSIIRLLPLWSSSIYLSVSIGCQLNLTVLQALTMDRSLGPHFTIPAGSMIVASFSGFVISLTFFDRIFFPLYRKLTGHIPTPLQRVGAGQLINAISMVASALVERKRVTVVHAHQSENQPGWIVPMSAIWLVLPLVLAGAAEALHFPGQVELYYKEFPKALKSTSTGMMALLIASGFYLSTAFIGVVRRVTPWLPDNINESRLENVYWMIAIVAMLNFAYYLVCAKFYKYQNIENEEGIKGSEMSEKNGTGVI